MWFSHYTFTEICFLGTSNLVGFFSRTRVDGIWAYRAFELAQQNPTTYHIALREALSLEMHINEAEKMFLACISTP